MSNKISKPKLIVILGPNASGKTSLSLKLAKKYHGEIISADSRQVFRGMDIGTGKATANERRLLPHHLIDIVSPRSEYNVAQFKKDALKTIDAILKRRKMPFLVGGTGFWIQAVVDNVDFPPVKPNYRLRNKLGKLSSAKLFSMLKKIDPVRARNIDRHNPYRLIRALEIIKATNESITPLKSKPLFEVLEIGLKPPLPKLHQLIEKRLQARFKQGLVNEVRRLHRQGISWRRLYDFGLEYRFVSLYLQQKLTYQQMVAELDLAIKHYAKRQLTWFKRDPRIHWVKNRAQASRLIKKFLIQ